MQVGPDIYAFQDRRDPCEFVKYSVNNSDTCGARITKTDLAQPTTPRFGPSLTGFKMVWVFAIGGDSLDQCEVYSIEEDVWYDAPSLKTQRADASSCEQGNYVYTFGGLKSTAGYLLDCFERLNASDYLSGK